VLGMRVLRAPKRTPSGRQQLTGTGWTRTSGVAIIARGAVDLSTWPQLSIEIRGRFSNL